MSDLRPPWMRAKWTFAMAALVLVALALFFIGEGEVRRDLVATLMMLIGFFLGGQAVVDARGNKVTTTPTAKPSGEDTDDLQNRG